MFIFLVIFIVIITLLFCLIGDKSNENRHENRRETDGNREEDVNTLRDIYELDEYNRNTRYNREYIDMSQRIDESIPGLIPIMRIIWGNEYVNNIINETNRLINMDENDVTNFLINQISNNQHPLMRQLLEIINEGGDRGVDDNMLRNLNVYKYDKRVEDKECGICLSNLEVNEKVTQLPRCIHIYHVECIVPWLKINNTCPNCRTEQ